MKYTTRTISAGRAMRDAGLATLTVAVAYLAPPGVTPQIAQAATSNTVVQWNKITEDAVIRSGAFQSEGFLYCAYVSAAVYDAVVAIKEGYQPYGPGVQSPAGASTDAAVVEAAYRTLINYFPTQITILEPLYTAALAEIPDGPARTDGQSVGLSAANLVISLRSNDGRMTPIATTSSFPTKTPGPGVWRLTPPAFPAPQTPWLGQVTPFFLQTPDQLLPDPPPPLSSVEWADAFEQIRAYGRATNSARTPEQTATALFWTANVVRQYNRAFRDSADQNGLSLLESARLQAMVNMVGADSLIALMNAKYHFLFWRPVTAIDPTAVTAADGFGPSPGFNDGNTLTTEETGWRPLVTTPNHPEYPAAHGVITSAITEVFTAFLGTSSFQLTVHGFDAAGSPGNMNAVRTFSRPNDLRSEIVDARLWAGVHYHFSGVAGVVLGRNVAKYDLRVALRPAR